ncbi:MAG: hypothetical protein QW568_03565 [Candidatus Anstonellaceae archaeon]
MFGKLRGQAAIESSNGSTARTLSMRGQAAMEYLMTYGWALLVIVIVIAILLIINPFSAPQGCRFEQIGFTCADPLIKTDGKLYLSITNGNNNAVSVVKVSCTVDKSTSPPSFGTTAGYPVNVARQGNLTLNGEPCKKADGSSLSLSQGGEFSGKLWIWYRNDEDPANYPNRTISANVVAKAVQ